MAIPQDILNFVQYLTSGGPNGGPLMDSQVLWERRQSTNFDAQWRQAVQSGLVNAIHVMGRRLSQYCSRREYVGRRGMQSRWRQHTKVDSNQATSRKFLRKDLR